MELVAIVTFAVGLWFIICHPFILLFIIIFWYATENSREKKEMAAAIKQSAEKRKIKLAAKVSNNKKQPKPVVS